MNCGTILGHLFRLPARSHRLELGRLSPESISSGAGSLPPPSPLFTAPFLCTWGKGIRTTASASEISCKNCTQTHRNSRMTPAPRSLSRTFHSRNILRRRSYPDTSSQFRLISVKKDNPIFFCTFVRKLPLLRAFPDPYRGFLATASLVVPPSIQASSCKNARPH